MKLIEAVAKFFACQVAEVKKDGDIFTVKGKNYIVVTEEHGWNYCLKAYDAYGSFDFNNTVFYVFE